MHCLAWDNLGLQSPWELCTINLFPKYKFSWRRLTSKSTQQLNSVFSFEFQAQQRNMKLDASMLFTHGLERSDLMHVGQRYSLKEFGNISWTIQKISFKKFLNRLFKILFPIFRWHSQTLYALYLSPFCFFYSKRDKIQFSCLWYIKHEGCLQQNETLYNSRFFPLSQNLLPCI